MVRLRPLTRLRLGFLALALVFLAPLGWLLHSSHLRLEEQRRLRHEVVAERIFDELERELTAVLSAEQERSSQDYDGFTDPVTWAPFIVGYFTTSDRGSRVVAQERLPEERRRRVQAALAQLESSLPAPPASPAPIDRVQEPDPLGPVAPEPKPPANSVRPKAARTGSAVLRQLNRGNEQRQRLAPESQRRNDPMNDYGY